jgi:hypothetical protein
MKPKTKFLLLTIFGLLAIALNIYGLFVYINEGASFRIFLRALWVVLFGIWTVSYFLKYRKASKE